MYIYISGKTEGLPINEVEAKYQQIELLLERFGGDVVNPLKKTISNGLLSGQYMIRRIEMLMECDSIFMLDNWNESTMARIEYDIAMRTGKNIYFESNIISNNEIILRIQGVIHEVMGLRFEDYTTRSRERNKYFARMVFVHHCSENNIDPTQYIRRDRTMIYHYLDRYGDEVKYNPLFRQLAQEVDKKLNQFSESSTA